MNGELALHDLRNISPYIGGPPRSEVPSLQILLRQSLEKTRERLTQRAEKLDHFEAKPDAFYVGVHERFEENFRPNEHVIVHPFGERFDVVNVETGSVEEIAASVLDVVKQHIERIGNTSVFLTTRMYPDTRLKV